MCNPCGAFGTMSMIPPLSEMLNSNCSVGKNSKTQWTLIGDNILTDAEDRFVDGKKLLMSMKLCLGAALVSTDRTIWHW